MAIEVQIKCINKTDRYNPHERIQAIGGWPGATTPTWKRSQAQAIIDIESDTYRYWVQTPTTDKVYIIVAKHNGNKYIKTTADGEHPNNLLSLPECQ